MRTNDNHCRQRKPDMKKIPSSTIRSARDTADYEKGEYAVKY